MLSGRKGIALIAVILVIIIISIAVLGIATLIANSIRAGISNTNNTRAFYAAQAGVYRVLYNYQYNSAYVTNPMLRNVALSSDLSFSGGTEANLLAINGSETTVAGTRVSVYSYNTNFYRTIYIKGFSVSYTFEGSSSVYLRYLFLSNSLVWTGYVRSGIVVNLPSLFPVRPRNANNIDIYFTGNVPTNAYILLTLYFNDGSSRSAMLRKDGSGGNYEVSFTATGRAGRGKMMCSRTLEATRDIYTANITSWQELARHID